MRKWLFAALAASLLPCYPQSLRANPITFAFNGTLLEPVNGSSTFSGFFTVNSNPNPQPGFTSVTEQGMDVSATLNIGGQVINYINTAQNTGFIEATVNAEPGIPMLNGSNASTTEFGLFGGSSNGPNRFDITLYNPGVNDWLTNLASLTLPAIHSDSFFFSDASGDPDDYGSITSLTLVPAPEPATILVYLTILAGLGLRFGARAWRSSAQQG
jgi:hypothetical protein